MAAGKKWSIGLTDIRTAFLYASAPEDRIVLLKPPQILIDLKVVEETEYWRLGKALYGLRESPRLWGIERDKQLANFRFKHEKIPIICNKVRWTIACGI